MADIISFGMAPAILSFQWGLSTLGRLGWAAGFLFVAAAAIRLARFNIQSAAGGDKRYFVGMPSPAAAGIIAATVFAYPWGLFDYRAALPALALVLVPAVLMVSTIRFRSFKNLDSSGRRPYTVLIFVAGAIMLVATHPRFMLVVVAYGYLASGLLGWAVSRFKHRGGRGALPPISRPHPIISTAPPADRTSNAEFARLAKTESLAGSAGFAFQSHAGRAIVTVVPTPRWLRTSIVPPFSSTFRFAIVRPRPVPVAFVEKYGSKIRFSAS